MFKKLTRADLDRYRATASFPEYVKFLSGLRKGEGGSVSVKAAGVGRPTVKKRLTQSAAAAGVKIRFVRSPADEVVFEALGKG